MVTNLATLARGPQVEAIWDCEDEEFLAAANRLIERGGAHTAEATEQRRYPQPKERELSDKEQEQIREQLRQGEGDIYKLAEEYACSSSQVTGIKARMS
ncbi:MAG: hypothetical protein ACP5XB_20300 [Isosphaeraceae bacterium]